MDTQKLKTTVQREIDQYKDEYIRVSKKILSTPESGFREHKTSRVVSEEFRRLDIPYENGIAITGLKGTIEGGKPGPTVAVIGELDSLIVPKHRYSDPDTGAAHACGHHCQIGMMLAVARGLKTSGVMKQLSGRVILLAIPAEEYIEIGYRDDLRQANKLEFLSGKSEFIRLGAFDDVDMAMMIHTGTSPTDAKFTLGASNNGMVSKRIKFHGVASHAGAAPHNGVNALNAATIAMSAIHAQRETYRDIDSVRVHPIFTHGGDAVSSVPSNVEMETFVRGRTVDAFLSASRKVDRALRAGAMSVGGSVEITTLPGYLPLIADAEMTDTFKTNACSLVGKGQVVNTGHSSGSTDMGDLSQIMPTTHPYVVAASGTAHGIDYIVEDYELGVITASKAIAITIVDLLSNGSKRAFEIMNRHQALMSKQEYLSFMREIFRKDTYSD